MLSWRREWITIESATLNTAIEAMSDNPFADFGDLFIHHLVFTAISSTTFVAPGTELGVLFAGNPIPAVGATAALDVTAPFTSDYNNRAAQSNRTQYRIRFPHDLTTDPSYASFHGDGVADLVRLLRSSTNVTVTYLVE